MSHERTEANRDRIERIANHQCIACATPLLPTVTTQRCDPCRVKFNAWHADRYAKTLCVDRVLGWDVPDVEIVDAVACQDHPVTPFEALARAEINQAIATEIRRLTSKEQTILEMIVFGGVTLESLADEFGLSRERIRQIEYNAIRKIREKLAARSIDAATIAG